MSYRIKHKGGELTCFIYKLGLSFFHPHFDTGRSYMGGIGIFFPTLLTIRPKVNWVWRWAGAIEVFGFGFGISWNHCDGPDYEYDGGEFGVKP